MESLILSVLPKGPLAIPIVVLAVIFYVYPKARELWYEHRDRTRDQSRLKQQLEILKLRYEIEALKRSHNIEPLLDDVSQEAVAPRSRSRPLEDSPLSPSRRRKLFLAAVLGALIIMVTNIERMYARNPSLEIAWFSQGISVMLFACFAGYVGVKLGRDNLARAFLIGVAFPFLLFGITRFVLQFR